MRVERGLGRQLEAGALATHAGTIVAKRRVPHVYCYSEALLAKPPDWGDHIDVCGFWLPGFSRRPLFTSEGAERVITHNLHHARALGKR